jgi:hypothetical protein
MEFGLQVLGQRAQAVVTGELRRKMLWLLLLLGGAVGGSLTATALAILGSVMGLDRIRFVTLTALIVAIVFITYRFPSREWGVSRQVGRRSSFGFTQPFPLMFFWGVELGSGIATVITKTATLAVGAIAIASPPPLAAVVGALYGCGRLARTWRPSFGRRDRNFTEPMSRYDPMRQRLRLANALFVTLVAVIAASLLLADLLGYLKG